jgi:hypothetical protein
MITAVDPVYDRLLHEIQPRVPRNRAENTRMLAEIENLMRKGEDHLNPAGKAMLGTLFNLVREYERRACPRGKTTAAQMLEFLMQQNNLSPGDMPLPANRLSEILSGRRSI